MSEIEKLYENANADKDCKLYANYGACPDKTKECTYCEYYVYPEFTAEKQLELIKWLAITRAILIKQNRIFVGFETGNPKDLKCAEDLDLNFEETLAGLINNLWQDLTDIEKEKIERILE